MKPLGIDELQGLKEAYKADRHLFVPGSVIRAALLLLGASLKDVELLRSASDGMPPDPTLEFRESRNARFYFDYDNSVIVQTRQQPFVLTEGEDFIRHDSGKARLFPGLQDELRGNTAFRALLNFKSYMAEGALTLEREGLDYSSPNYVCTTFQLRVKTGNGIIGEPALEGVHSDGVDHTMTTFLASRNMGCDAAKTRLHLNSETTGISWSDSNDELIVTEVQHRDFLDTLLIADHEYKHSVTSLTPLVAHQPCHRDMLIFFTRKPAVAAHPSHEFDNISDTDATFAELRIPDLSQLNPRM